VDVHVRQRIVTGGATPCVLLHGLAVSHRYLMPTARELGERPVYVPDLPGFGSSPSPAGVLDVGQQADVVVELLAPLGPVVLLGHSFGSQVAVEVALRRPDLVPALVLAGLCTDPAGATAPRQIGRLLLSLPSEQLVRQAPMVARDIRDAGPARILRTLHHAVRDHVQPKLPMLRMPVLLIRGGHDHVAPQDWQDHAAALIPRARAVTVDHAAHNVVTTAGPETAAEVRAFLSDL
jgi:pimeloyl-ACP methyl ester carboxylesterase